MMFRNEAATMVYKFCLVVKSFTWLGFVSVSKPALEALLVMECASVSSRASYSMLSYINNVLKSLNVIWVQISVVCTIPYWTE